jgi:hypothetical protein
VCIKDLQVSMHKMTCHSCSENCDVDTVLRCKDWSCLTNRVTLPQFCSRGNLDKIKLRSLRHKIPT